MVFVMIQLISRITMILLPLVFTTDYTVVIRMLARYPEDADQGSSEEEDLDRRNVVREARYVKIATTFTSFVLHFHHREMTITLMITSSQSVFHSHHLHHCH